MPKQKYGYYKGIKRGTKLRRSAWENIAGTGLRLAGRYIGDRFIGGTAGKYMDRFVKRILPKRRYIARLGSNRGVRSIIGSNPGGRVGSNPGPKLGSNPTGGHRSKPSAKMARKVYHTPLADGYVPKRRFKFN